MTNTNINLYTDKRREQTIFDQKIGSNFNLEDILEKV